MNGKITPTTTLMLDENQLRDLSHCLLRELRRVNEFEASIPRGGQNAALSAELSKTSDRLDRLYSVINRALTEIEQPH